jgi:hypothetical protein
MLESTVYKEIAHTITGRPQYLLYLSWISRIVRVPYPRSGSRALFR